ncbi:DUF4073 domain-containing protein, partial [Schinkia azotoformans]|uniref:DUF4073 domain-containing protein n=2 Tax=Schinkia azotoformans TaxID=1454 RepID=UPI002DBDC711
YQWKKDGIDITGATSATLTINNAQETDEGSYTVVVTNAAGNVTSTAATLTVTPAPVAPTITTEPSDQTVTAGGTATFTVIATGDAPLSYQWKKDGIDIAGATSASLTINNAQESDEGSYTVVVTNGAGNVTSTAATLTVNPVPVTPTYTIAAINNQTFNALTTGYGSGSQEIKTLTITRTGTGDLNNVAVALSGSNANDFVITQPGSTTLDDGIPSTDFTVKAEDGLTAGTYTATITISADNMTSVSFTVTQMVNNSSPQNPSLNISTATFDKKVENQTDVTVNITLNGSTLSSIENGSVPLVLGTDYTVTSGDTITIKKEYLEKQNDGTTNLVFNFDPTYSAILAVAINNTTPQPAAPNVLANDSENNLVGANSTMEYSTDNGVTWKTYDDPTFNGNVTVLVRVKANDHVPAGLVTTVSFTTNSSSGGGGGGSSTTPSTNTEKITVVVETGDFGKGTNIFTATINRTTDASGQKKDDVTFAADQAKETVKKAKESGQETARIVIPDTKDEVVQVDVKIPITATNELVSGGLDLEIYTENVRINLPAASLEGLQEDLYFKVVPIKEEPKRQEVENRAKSENVVKMVVGNGKLEVIGRPMTIETNLENRPVDLVLPLRDITLPTDEQERQAFLADLVIFIEHSDGEQVLVKPEVVNYKSGQLGLKFGITKFSTFTILNMENWEEYLAEQDANKAQKNQEKNSHGSYVAGFPDGTYKPEKSVSRAEMAALLVRVGAELDSDAPAKTFADVSSNHWANNVIQKASATGLMKGFTDGTFAPDKSITRAEMAAIVSRWLQLTGDVKTSNLSDIKGSWAEKDIKLVEQAGIMKGMPNGQFQPNKALTRAETVVIFNRILKRGPLQGVEVPTWKDVSSKHWAFSDIEEASKDHRFIVTETGEQLVNKE